MLFENYSILNTSYSPFFSFFLFLFLFTPFSSSIGRDLQMIGDLLVPKCRNYPSRRPLQAKFEPDVSSPTGEPDRRNLRHTLHVSNCHTSFSCGRPVCKLKTGPIRANSEILSFYLSDFYGILCHLISPVPPLLVPSISFRNKTAQSPSTIAQQHLRRYLLL
jgi:hypothetical protein